MTSVKDDPGFANEMFLLAIFFDGPWAKLSNWCYGIRKGGDELSWEIPEHPRGVKWVLAKVGDWAEVRDRAWREKFATRRKEPHDRWRRR